MQAQSVERRAFRDSEVLSEAPARIDFSHGGGSDLPAICEERGGRAINLSVSINGDFIRSRVKRIDRPEIVLYAREIQDQPILLRTREDLRCNGAVSDPFCLHKAALRVVGLFPEEDPRPLETILRAWGGGLEIHTETGLPVGSGLGASSILAATLVAALRRICGQPDDRATLVRDVLEIERLLGACGGWQDPLGGIFGGLKSIASPPGPIPHPAVTDLPLSETALACLKARMMLCHVGKSHFAGDVIQRLTQDYQSRRQPPFAARERLEKMDDSIARTLQAGDMDALGSLLDQFWQDFLILVPEATTPHIERVFAAVRDDIAGGKACGAGGGGCLLLIAREGKKASVERALQNLFRTDPDFREGRLLETEVDLRGLIVQETVRLEQASDLLQTLEATFLKADAGLLSADAAPAYRFSPCHHTVGSDGLNFHVILNPERAKYVAETLRRKQQAEQEGAHCIRPEAENLADAIEPKRLADRPHVAPPGCEVCPFDNLQRSGLTVQGVRSGQTDYWVVLNGRPWGHCHFMLVTQSPEPQRMTEEHFRAALGMLDLLGERYEGVYNGAGGAASILHYHIHFHRGQAAIWQSLDSGLLGREICSEGRIRTSFLRDWPAPVFLLEGADPDDLSGMAARAVDQLTAEGRDIPCNLLIRCRGGLRQILLFLRSGHAEKPGGLNTCPASWGRFGALEMAGSILLLDATGFEEMQQDPKAGDNIRKAITEMGLDAAQTEALRSGLESPDVVNSRV